MSKKDSIFRETLQKNIRTLNQYQSMLLELTLSSFKWINLPDTVDERFLELTLATDGQALFFNDEIIGNLALQFSSGGKLNIYNVPTVRYAYGCNGYFNECDETNSIVIYNNLMRSNSLNDIKMYSERLYELDRVIDVNCRAQKTPILIKCAENQRLTMLNLYKKYDGNEPIIFGDNQLNTSGISTINTGAPFVADKIFGIKEKLWNEALTKLGISNVGFQKRERLITSEIETSQGGTLAFRQSKLKMRKIACTQINKMFGLNIDCVFSDEQPDYNGGAE